MTNPPAHYRLFFEPEGRLRMETESECWTEVSAVWAAPLTRPNEYLAIVDGKGREIFMVRRLEDLPDDVRPIIEAELRNRYLASQIVRIEKVRFDFGVATWRVTTSRGEREFVTQNMNENVYWVSPNHLMITDVDGNRFEIKDITALDAVSRKHLAGMI